MNNALGAFGIAVRKARMNRNLTQIQLAEKLGMSKRTVIQAERGQSNPKFETIVLLAQELEISLDAILFPDIALTENVSLCVYEFFKDKSQHESQKFIDLCRNVASLNDNS